MKGDKLTDKNQKYEKIQSFFYMLASKYIITHGSESEEKFREILVKNEQGCKRTNPFMKCILTTFKVGIGGGGPAVFVLCLVDYEILIPSFLAATFSLGLLYSLCGLLFDKTEGDNLAMIEHFKCLSPADQKEAFLFLRYQGLEKHKMQVAVDEAFNDGFIMGGNSDED